LAVSKRSAVPPELREQLKVGGIMVIPVGPEGEEQKMLKIRRVSETKWTEEELGGCRFVPFLTGVEK